MHPTIPLYLAALWLVLELPAGTGKSYLNLSPTGNSKKIRTCALPNNITGICVHKSVCSNEHNLEIGGRIIESELRVSSDCNIPADEWCCSLNNVTDPTLTKLIAVTVPPGPTPTTAAKTARNCIFTDKVDCPWFVKLYRSGESSPYCLGALIGSKVILTSATCELQARDQFLWATVPSSTRPEANYTVINRLRHPKYNSGTRLNDIALLSLLTNIEWGSDGPKGACIDPQQSLGGECTAASVNEYDDLNMVSLFVTPGACSGRGNVSDAACGTGLFDNPLPHGAPIMCQKNNMYVLSGLTKRSYDSQRAILGRLDYPWLIQSLKEIIGLEDRQFLLTKNYK